MNKIVIFLIGCISLAIANQKDAFCHKVEQEAVKSAVEFLQDYYAHDICVADSIYDLDWSFFSSRVDVKLRPCLESYRQEKKWVWDRPVHSEVLDSLFGPDASGSGRYKYVAEFAAPYKGLIRCDVLPWHRRIGILGVPRYLNFLFKYNDKGEIYQICTIVTHVD